ETAGKTTHEVTGALIEQVRERRRAEGASESTWNKEVSWLRAFYGDLLDAIREQPDCYVPLVSPIMAKKHFYPETHHRTRHLSDDEEGRLRDALPAAAWPKVAVAMLTGFDLEVQFGLRWAEDVNFEARTVRGWRREGRQRKLSPDDVPLRDDLAAVLRALPSRLKSPGCSQRHRNEPRARPALRAPRVRPCLTPRQARRLPLEGFAPHVRVPAPPAWRR